MCNIESNLPGNFKHHRSFDYLNTKISCSSSNRITSLSESVTTGRDAAEFSVEFSGHPTISPRDYGAISDSWYSVLWWANVVIYQSLRWRLIDVLAQVDCGRTQALVGIQVEQECDVIPLKSFKIAALWENCPVDHAAAMMGWWVSGREIRSRESILWWVNSWKC